MPRNQEKLDLEGIWNLIDATHKEGHLVKEEKINAHKDLVITGSTYTIGVGEEEESGTIIIGHTNALLTKSYGSGIMLELKDDQILITEYDVTYTYELSA